MRSVYSRREILTMAGRAAAMAALAPHLSFAKEELSQSAFGAVVGEPLAAKIGEQVLAEGGNAIDAAVTTALAASITSPSKCGVGGYGGHAIVALAGGKKVVAIDFNSTAPAAAREDMFPVDAKGNVKNKLNMHGWLAAGVPGTLAGLDLLQSRYGTRSLSQVLAPSIALCEEGVHLAQVKGPDDASRNDASPESFSANKGPKTQNLALAKLLRLLAERNSTESFYRGDIARKIAADFQKHGGLVTFEDLAAYRAREGEPVKMEWNGFKIYTPPLTSPGLMMVEALSILKELKWDKLPAPAQLQAKIDALRVAWADRTKYFGDPEKVKVPVDRLTSRSHISDMAEKVAAALKKKQALPLALTESADDGTMNISAVDRHGNMVAITLTHGSTFGARVSVEEYGMVLGHGMWRFEPRPGHPNSVGPGKRAVNNMCPSAVLRDGKPVLAVGAAGGTRIPNSIYEVLLNFAGRKQTVEIAVAALRLQTTGTLELELEKIHSPGDEATLRSLGYKTKRGYSAYVSAVYFDSKTRTGRGASRGGAF